MSETEDEHHEMVMPFVVCESEGGPYPDEAFVAGVNFGRHRYEIVTCPGMVEWSEWVFAPMVPQYDLLAMDTGYVMTVITCPEESDGCWVLVQFNRPEQSEEDVIGEGGE